MEQEQKTIVPVTEEPTFSSIPVKKSNLRLIGIISILSVIIILWISAVFIEAFIRRNNLQKEIDTAFSEAQTRCGSDNLVEVTAENNLINAGKSYSGSTVTSPSYPENFEGYYCSAELAAQSLSRVVVDGNLYDASAIKEQTRREDLFDDGRKYFTPSMSLTGYSSTKRYLSDSGYFIDYFSSTTAKTNGISEASFSCYFGKDLSFGSKTDVGATDVGGTIYQNIPGQNQILSYTVDLEGVYCYFNTSGSTTETEALSYLKSIKIASKDEISSFNTKE